MMGTLQEYVTYEFQTRCGLPSVTLLGEQSDWEDILARLEKIPSFGKEPSQWYKLLKPVLTRFVRSFDEPKSEPTKAFWTKIVHGYKNGSDPKFYTGWITAFIFWEADGKSLYVPHSDYPKNTVQPWSTCPTMELDGVSYHRVNIGQVPPAFVSVPVKWNNAGAMYETLLVAGSVGTRVARLPQSPGAYDVGLYDTVSPGVGWWLFEKKSNEEIAAQKEARYKESD